MQHVEEGALNISLDFSLLKISLRSFSLHIWIHIGEDKNRFGKYSYAIILIKCRLRHMFVIELSSGHVLRQIRALQSAPIHIFLFLC